jgi:hypothetical protein
VFRNRNYLDLRGKEFRELHRSSSTVRQAKLRSLHVAQMGMARHKNVCRILVWILSEKRSLDRTKRIWEDSIKMDHRSLGWEEDEICSRSCPMADFRVSDVELSASVTTESV